MSSRIQVTVGCRTSRARVSPLSAPSSRKSNRHVGAAAGRAHHWWAVGLRSLAAILFGLSLLLLPSSTITSLVLLFAAYVTADGLPAIIAAPGRAAAVGRYRRGWHRVCLSTSPRPDHRACR